MVLSKTRHPKRACIFFVFDKQGVIDSYIPYLLRDLKENLNYLLIVVNGVLSESGREKLSAITSNIFVRDNVGFDVWAYKEGLEYIGWDQLAEYDEVVLADYTNFGPVYPFREAFDAMDGRDVDFWGLTKHYGHYFDPNKKCKYGNIPAHIQSSFIVIRRSMLMSPDFRQYWDNMPPIQSYEESFGCHEAIFTKDFEDKGYKSDVYINTDDLAQCHEYPLMLYALELVKKRRCPVFRRKSFFNIYEEFLSVSCGQSTWELYNYLKNETNYDVRMIWENILRTANMYDIKNRMQLNYILPTEVKLPSDHNARTALFIHLYDLSVMDTLIKYVENMPVIADIIITTSSEEKKENIRHVFSTIKCHELIIIVIPNAGRDVSALLIGLRQYVKNYDYICFIHDKQTKHISPLIQGQSFAYKCYENVLASKKFVENVIKTFHENPNLGLLMPPPPNHGSFFNVVGNEWQTNYLSTKDLSDKLGLQVDIDPKKPPIAPLGTCFWFRPKALQLLFDYNYTYDDFPSEPLTQVDATILHAIERIYPFVAQNEGYYSGWLISDVFVKFEITNLYEQLRDCYLGNRHFLLNSYGERIEALLDYVSHLETDIKAYTDTIRQRDESIGALGNTNRDLYTTLTQRDDRLNRIQQTIAYKLLLRRKFRE